MVRESAIAHDLSVRTANLATLATTSKSGVLLDRVAFRTAGDGSHELAAQVGFAVLDDTGREIPLRQLQERTAAPLFPAVSIQIADARLTDFSARMSAFAPFSPLDAAGSRSKAAVFTIAHTGHGGEFSFRWRVRLFPARGGALRVERGDHWMLLHNDVVGVIAPDAELYGSDDAPLGLDLLLIYRKRPGELRSLAGANLSAAIVGFDATHPDPSGAASLVDLATTTLKGARNSTVAIANFGSAIPCEPSEATVAAGLSSRVAALANFANMRERGGRTLFVPAEGPASAAAFFEDEWTLLQTPARERTTVEWLLSTQAADGSIRGDDPAEATEAAAPIEIERDCYTVLRGCRWYRWTYDGDAFRGLAPRLKRALDRARERFTGIAGDVAAPTPAGPQRLSTFHLRCALFAAHHALAESLAQLGNEEAAAKELEASADAMSKELAALPFAAPGGDSNEDAREQAAALVFELFDAARTADLAKRLAALPPAKDPVDWREAVLARGLLTAGLTEAGRARTTAIDLAIRDVDFPFASAIAAYHTALFFGTLGIRRDDLGTLEFVPRLLGREQVRTLVTLPEGPIRIQLQPPNVQFHRQLVVQNDSTLDLMLVVGVPGGLGNGERRTVGPTQWSLYQQLLPATQAWRELVR